MNRFVENGVVRRLGRRVLLDIDIPGRCGQIPSADKLRQCLGQKELLRRSKRDLKNRRYAFKFCCYDF